MSDHESLETIERLKEEAKCLGYRLSKIPDKKGPGDEKPKKLKRAVYLVHDRPQFRIEDDVDLKTLDRSDERFVTCSEPELRVLSKLFMTEDNSADDSA